MASQTQPIIPVTMPIGGGYGGGHAALQHDIFYDGQHTRDHVQHETDEIRNNQRWDTEFTRQDIRNAQDYDAAATTAATIALRGAVDRNVDYLSNQAEVNAGHSADDKTQILLAAQNNTSDVKTALAATLATLSGQATNNQNLTGSGMSQLGIQIATVSSLTNQNIITQAQSVLLGQKDQELQAASNFGAIQLLSQQNFQATQLAQAKDTAAIQLQAAGYNAKVMEKLAECCCENKMAHSATQAVVVQSGSNNSASIQQGQYNSMTQQLFQVQQELLFAKLSSKDK